MHGYKVIVKSKNHHLHNKAKKIAGNEEEANRSVTIRNRFSSS